MVQSPFVWGKAGAKLTPEEIARQREIEDRLVQQGVDTSPVGHWTQGLARVANAMAGAFRRGQLENAANENAAYNAGQVKSWFGGSDFPAAPASSTAALPATAAGAQMSASSPAPDVSKNGDTFSPFIDTVRAGGLTNPYGLAAVAATGRAESGWSPQNAARSWSDPSESGQAGSAGGILSWRADRLANLQRYAASKGEQGNGSPQTQAEYFMREDPGLIAKLNAAKSADEAQGLMNNAWKFAGYNRPGGEAARRLGYANAYLSQFQGGTETASLDPAAGMPPAAAAIEAQAPRVPAPYRDPMIVQSPEATALAAQEEQAAIPPYARHAAPPLPMPIDVATPPAQPVNEAQLLAQAIRQRGGNPQAGILPVITGEQGQTGTASSGPNMQALMGAMADPRLTEGNKRIAEILIRQQMEQQQAAREAAIRQAERQATWAREDNRNAFLDKREAEKDAYGRQKDESTFGLQQKEFDFKVGEASRTSDIKEYEFAKGQGYVGTFADYQRDMKKAAAASTSVNVGGGSDKQVFDEMKASADAARSAATGLTALREARKAVEGGAILGAGADTKLGLQKLAVGLGLANPEAVQNTETFRAAIAPQIASLMKATVGSTQISNADRDFAEKAAGGSITLEKGTILRLLDIMERAGDVVVQSHASRLNKVYPEGANFDRERALFGVDIPAPQADPQAVGIPQAGTVMDGYRFKGGDPSDQRNWEQVK